MALPSTHLRFALDLADTFPVADMGIYISGTMYPDSRWITGRRREETHGDSCRSPETGPELSWTTWKQGCKTPICNVSFPGFTPG